MDERSTSSISKEVSEMAVLSKPVNVSFQLDPKKSEAFLEVSKKKLFDKAMDRANAHNKNKKKKGK